MERTIVFDKLDNPADILLLKDYLREIYRLLDPRLVTVAYAASVVYDADEGEIFLTELTGNITGITLKNGYAGRKITIIFLQDGTGNRTVAGWAATVLITGNAFTPTATADVYSTLTFVHDGTNWVEIARALDVK